MEFYTYVKPELLATTEIQGRYAIVSETLLPKKCRLLSENGNERMNKVSEDIIESLGYLPGDLVLRHHDWDIVMDKYFKARADLETSTMLLHKVLTGTKKQEFENVNYLYKHVTALKQGRCSTAAFEKYRRVVSLLSDPMKSKSLILGYEKAPGVITFISCNNLTGNISKYLKHKRVIYLSVFRGSNFEQEVFSTLYLTPTNLLNIPILEEDEFIYRLIKETV